MNELVKTAAGHPLNRMVRDLNTSAAQRKEPDRIGISGQMHTLKLSPHALKTPALLINQKMEIIWQNQTARQEIWHVTASLPEEGAHDTIFDYLFNPHFQSSVTNWRQWVLFFLQHALGMISPDELQALISGLEERQKTVLLEMLGDPVPPFNRNVFSGRIRQVNTNGFLATYWVVATDFQEGRLFVFDSAFPAMAETGMARAADIEQKMEIARQLTHPATLPVHILAARLNNAQTLRTELLSEEYSRLLNRIWQRTIEALENYGGIVGHLSDSALCGYFIPTNKTDHNPFFVIECALELKSQMAEVGREWKIRKGWLHDIELNMGIHSANECIGVLRSSLGDNLTTFGSTLHTALFLSRLATNGAIWTTKDVVTQMPTERLKHLRFGIFRQDNQRQVFISKCFSRVGDLGLPSAQLPDAGHDLEVLAVTQIFDAQR